MVYHDLIMIIFIYFQTGFTWVKHCWNTPAGYADRCQTRHWCAFAWAGSFGEVSLQSQGNNFGILNSHWAPPCFLNSDFQCLNLTQFFLVQLQCEVAASEVEVWSAFVTSVISLCFLFAEALWPPSFGWIVQYQGREWCEMPRSWALQLPMRRSGLGRCFDA